MTRVAVRTILVAAALTTATAVAHFGLTPRTGFVRSFYPTADFDSVPVQQARATDVSLDFLKIHAVAAAQVVRSAVEGFWYVQSGEFGTVAVGRRADLVLLEADPLRDVAHVARRAGVMVGGRWLSEDDLREALTN